jgi:hypothetical protein
MQHLVYDEGVTFCYLDFINFEVDGREHKITHGTFRNYISRLIKDKVAEVSCKSNPTFYNLRGVNLGNARRMAMTGNHMGVVSSSSSSSPLYRLLRDLPLGKNSVHDIRLRFPSPEIYVIINSAISNGTLGYDYTVIARSNDILLPVWIIRDLLIRVTIHMTDTVSVAIGCSLNPVTLDINGLIRLTNALSVVEERLASIVETSVGNGGFGATGTTYISPRDQRRRARIVPAHSEWMVTMWHFGADASVEYSGERFCFTWETAENVLRAYSKVAKNRRMRIRLERQEYPKVTLADIIEQKLSSSKRFS